MIDSPGWLSSAAAAELLGVTTRTLYKFIDQGQRPAYRFGRVIRLRARDVGVFIDSHRIPPGTLHHLYPDPPDDDGRDADQGDDSATGS